MDVFNVLQMVPNRAKDNICGETKKLQLDDIRNILISFKTDYIRKNVMLQMIQPNLGVA